MSVAITDTEFDLLRDYLRDRCGLAIPTEKRYLFETRFGRCLAEYGCESFSDLYERLTAAGDGRIEAQLIEAMTTHETSFFRDTHPFETFAREILPELSRRRNAETRYTPPRLRIWSAGCSTGEEPYSLAMSVHDWLATQSHYDIADVSVLASDISRSALAAARRGIFTDKQIRTGLSAGRKREYLRETKAGWAVRGDVRAMVYFAEVNLSKDFRQLGFFDVILCRNVIIYFSLEVKRQILERFYEMLNPGGVLLLGASESIYQLSERFRPVHSGPTTYYVRDGAGGDA